MYIQTKSSLVYNYGLSYKHFCTMEICYLCQTIKFIYISVFCGGRLSMQARCNDGKVALHCLSIFMRYGITNYSSRGECRTLWTCGAWTLHYSTGDERTFEIRIMNRRLLNVNEFGGILDRRYWGGGGGDDINSRIPPGLRRGVCVKFGTSS